MLTISTFVLPLLIFGFCSSSVFGACPPVYDEVGGGCFLVIDAPFDFTSAREVCRSYNGDLAVVNDCSLLGNLSTYLLANYPSNDVWVGASDLASEGEWYWINGTLVEFGAPFWARTNPERYEQEPNGGTNQNCAAMGVGGGYYFRDLPCDLHIGYAPLCEVSPDPMTGSCPSPYELVGGSHCFELLSTVDVTWEDARAICQNTGGDLAIINDCNVMKSVIDFAEETGSVPGVAFWIGGTDEASEGNWQWVDGSSMAMGATFWGLTYDGPLQPDDADGKEDCLALWADNRFLFNDVPCTDEAFPLCQVDPNDLNSNSISIFY